MLRLQPILIYSISFLILALFFNAIGIINLDNFEILAYAFVFYGLSTVYVSMGMNKKLKIFLGSSIFLIGIDFLVMSSFDIINNSSLIFPSFLFILGISSLILFLDNTDDKAIFFISIVFILLGIIYSTSVGSLGPVSFIQSFVSLLSKYWIILVLTLAVFLLVRRRKEE